MRTQLLAAVWLAALSPGAAHQPKAEAQAEREGGTQEAAKTIANALREIRPNEDKGCNGRQDNRGSDLCAQWSAVDAARNNVLATWAAVILSFAGTFLIFLTFVEQRKTSRAELRAYIEVKGKRLIINGTTGEAETDLEIINNGQTPALETRWAGNIVVKPIDQVERDLRATNAADIYPHGTPTVTTIHGKTSASGGLSASPPLKIDDVMKAISGELALIVFGTVWYKDAFEKRRYTNFCFISEEVPDPREKNRQPRFRDGHYQVAPFHNDSN